MSQNERIKGLDGLRGGYALCIVFYHFWAGRAGVFRQGYLAVDFFFIVSGFLLIRTCANGKYQSGGQYAKCLLKRYWPVTTIILLLFLMKKILEEGISAKWVIHAIYEVLYLHTVGIASEEYIFSPIWYLPVLIFISGVYFELYRVNKTFMRGAILPVIILLSYSYLFAKYGDLSDFRAIDAGDYFIKGIYRGAGGMGIGCLLYMEMPAIQGFCLRLRPSVILAVELLDLLLIVGIIFAPLGSGADILILPCSCVLITNCCMEIGVIYRLMEISLMKWLGRSSLYIYLTQGFALGLTPYIVKRLFGITDLSVWRIEAGITLLALTVFVAIFFQHIVLPAALRGTKKLVYRKEKMT